MNKRTERIAELEAENTELKLLLFNKLPKITNQSYRNTTVVMDTQERLKQVEVLVYEENAELEATVKEQGERLDRIANYAKLYKPRYINNSNKEYGYAFSKIKQLAQGSE